MVKPRRKLALVDGVGEDCAVHLCWGDDDDVFEDINWPENWDSFVSRDFLKSEGYEVINV